MSDIAPFLDALRGIGARVGGEMSEKDVENAFLNEEFYSRLGYEGAGHDLRSEMTLPDDRRPDYITLDDNESVTAVYEFKTSGERLSDHEDQLFHYVSVLGADYGVLTNGEEFRLYRRDGPTRTLTLSLADATEGQAEDLQAALRKPEWDVRDPERVTEYLDALDPVGLDGELGREHFFDTFRLEADSPFADLVTAMMDLLDELREERSAEFVTGPMTSGRRAMRASLTRRPTRGSRSSTVRDRCGSSCSVSNPATRCSPDSCSPRRPRTTTFSRPIGVSNATSANSAVASREPSTSMPIPSRRTG